MVENNKDITLAWQQHWQEGHLSSLSQDNKSHESQQGRAAWNAFFEDLPGTAKILDLCTGNGIVPALANTFARENGRGFIITGVDQAKIDPHTTLEEGKELLEGVTFQGGVNIEALPFDDGAFDAVTGQYAIEYSNLEKTIPEIARTLKKGGKFRFVIHAREGTIIAHNTPKTEQYDFILNQSGILEALSEAVRLAFDAEISTRPEVQEMALEARSNLRDLAVTTKAGVQGVEKTKEPLILIENLVRAYITRKQYGNYIEFEEWLSGVRVQIEGQLEMIKSFSEVAISRAGLFDIQRFFEEAGLSELILLGDVRGADGDLQAWTIEGVKA